MNLNLTPAAYEEIHSILAMFANLDAVTPTDTGEPNTVAFPDLLEFASRGLALLEGTETASEDEPTEAEAETEEARQERLSTR